MLMSNSIFQPVRYPIQAKDNKLTPEGEASGRKYTYAWPFMHHETLAGMWRDMWEQMFFLQRTELHDNNKAVSTEQRATALVWLQCIIEEVQQKKKKKRKTHLASLAVC